LIAGLIIQFSLAAMVLRWDFGFELFKFLGDQMTIFLSYTNYGSELVFGETYYQHYIIFKGLPIGIFFAAVVNVLYYFGIVQYLILKFSWLVNKLLSTSPSESMIAVASIFLGQAEAPLLVKPFLSDMTDSEVFVVMICGFSTVAGSTLAAYVGFGVPANHLLSASIISAPAALSIGKLIFPETEKTKVDWVAIKNLPQGVERNVFEAFSMGAINMLKPIGCVVANLIVYRSFFQFLDFFFQWIFYNLNLQNFGLVNLLQYPFSILAFLMGVDNEDCFSVGKLFLVYFMYSL
jgi:pyrimidine nucleoside transport protein